MRFDFSPEFAPVGHPAQRDERNPLILAFDAIGYKRRGDEPLPEKPIRREVPPAARGWSWIMTAVLIAALMLPFSLAALVDLARYLER